MTSEAEQESMARRFVLCSNSLIRANKLNDCFDPLSRRVHAIEPVDWPATDRTFRKTNYGQDEARKKILPISADTALRKSYLFPDVLYLLLQELISFCQWFILL